jgi:hypothetical protein
MASIASSLRRRLRRPRPGLRTRLGRVVVVLVEDGGEDVRVDAEGAAPTLVAMKLPIELHLAVGTLDHLGRPRKWRRRQHTVNRGDIETGHTRRAHDGDALDTAIRVRRADGAYSARIDTQGHSGVGSARIRVERLRGGRALRSCYRWSMRSPAPTTSAARSPRRSRDAATAVRPADRGYGTVRYAPDPVAWVRRRILRRAATGPGSWRWRSFASNP